MISYYLPCRGLAGLYELKGYDLILSSRSSAILSVWQAAEDLLLTTIRKKREV
jgi:hypothetical protein